ncbi:protein kinase [Micromonospora sp. NPDC049679]|uniref:serine/threonine-protein kinase n=1 Tax=Micromonospora sp. NPDC049679 TaxID=3155920 RepID=UPI0033F1853B
MQARNRIADRYELTYPIGRGGMGEVWAGYDERLDRPVAIKFLRQMELPDDERETAAKRFRREARATARLDHPGVPTVHDLGVHGDDLFIVMQLVSGVVLADLIAEEGQLPASQAASIAAQICAVLTAAHAASLVHRDLKPQNVIVTPTGTVKVLDFGVAALLGPAEASRLTTTGHMLGTPAYLAPEQASDRPVGPPADLYALGCILFELLTGHAPYEAHNALDMLRQHRQAPVPIVSEHRGDVPDDLAHLVFCLLAKDPQERPASAVQVGQLLTPFVGGEHRPLTATANHVSGRTEGSPIVQLPARVLSTDLAEARARVQELAEEERFTQAAEVLESALRTANDGRDYLDPQILLLRLDMAELRMLAGEYRKALHDFEALAHQLEVGSDPDLAERCRQQALVCHAELGQPHPS